MNIIGAFGSLCFAFCLFPQVIKAYKEKSANGLSWLFLWLSVGGNVASCAYVAYTNYISGLWQYPLYFNYGFALVLCVLLIAAKLRFVKNGIKDIHYWKNRLFEFQKLSVEQMELNNELLEELKAKRDKFFELEEKVNQVLQQFKS